MKIIFFGTDKYSQVVLNSLKKERKFQILKVVSPAMLKENCWRPAEQPEVGVLASFGAIVPPEVLNFPQKGILNIHPSLLPKYRGASPVQAAILAGEKQTGVTIIKMDERVDHGPIVAKLSEKILPTDTAESLYFRLFSAGAEALKKILPAYLEGRIKLQPQNHSQATYAKRLTRDDGFIPPERLKAAMEGKEAKYLERMIRAFYPWPGTWTEIKIKTKNQEKETPTSSLLQTKKRLKILKAHLEGRKLILDIVQLEGKKPVTFKQFQEGYPQVKIE